MLKPRRPGPLSGTFYLCSQAMLVSCLTFCAFAQAAETPNVVLCMADDLGWGDVGFNGARVIATPHLDAMAAGGVRFTRFYAAAPVCSPTRGSVLTGRNPFRYGVFTANAGHLPKSEPNLAQLLRQRGYATGHFGKWHLGTLSTQGRDSNRGGARNQQHFAPPWLRGFDATFSTEAKVPTFDPLLRPAGVNRNTWWDPVSSPDDARPYGTAYFSAGQVVADDLRGDDSALIMDRAIRFIQRAAADDSPFLAVVWFHAPHLPVVASREQRRRYAEQDKYAQHYYGCITALDEQMGRLRTELRRLGVAQDTMLWFCADNGPEGQADNAPGSASHLRGRKRDLFEGGVRVPGCLEWPSEIAPGSVIDAPCVTSDYLPTVCELLDVAPPDVALDGTSLAPLLQGRAQERGQPIGFQFRGQLAWMTDRYKLLFRPRKPSGHWYAADAEGEWMLFDIDADPGEQRDLASQHPAVVEQMRDELLAWVESCRRDHAGLVGDAGISDGAR